MYKRDDCQLFGHTNDYRWDNTQSNSVSGQLACIGYLRQVGSLGESGSRVHGAGWVGYRISLTDPVPSLNQTVTLYISTANSHTSVKLRITYFVSRY